MKLLLAIILPIIFFCATGLISGTVNNNSLDITLLGVFIYVKMFLVIVIYGAVFNFHRQFNKIFKGLVILTVILGLGAFIEEIWALSFRYIMGMDIFDNGVYLFRTRTDAGLLDSWRRPRKSGCVNETGI